MSERMTWASTPEAKAKLAARVGKPEPRKKSPCPAMEKARKQAEKAMEGMTGEKPPSAETDKET